MFLYRRAISSFLVIKGGDKRIDCTPPHDVPLKPFRPLLVKPMSGTENITVPEGGAELTPQQTADLINDLILRSQELLKNHPLNQKRMAEGKDPANSIWPWSPGYRPKMERLSDKFPQVKRGAVISAVDLINGIIQARCTFHCQATQVRIISDTIDQVYSRNHCPPFHLWKLIRQTFHFRTIAGHEGNVNLKLLTIENLDSRAVGPIYEAVKDWEEPVAIAVLPDHPTPCELRTHTNEPIPFFIWYPGIEPDSVQTFDEASVCEGSYGLMKEDEFINEFMKS